MELKDLKQGDRLRFHHGYDFIVATVLENFPVQKKIRLEIPHEIRIFEYSNHSFDLWNVLEPDKPIIEEVSNSSKKKSSGFGVISGLATFALGLIEVVLER
jgi:hypothetical protein